MFHLVFLWLPSVEICLKRVAERVDMGGHYVPGAVVKRRYLSGIKNLRELYLPISNSWRIICNENIGQAYLVAEKKEEQPIEVHNFDIWNKICGEQSYV